MRPERIHRTSVLHHHVAPTDTAQHWGNRLPVLATPVLLWLGEVAAMQAMAPAYEGGEMCVGLSHDEVVHVAPSLVGHRIEIMAQLLDHTDRSARFSVTARDGDREVFRGVHTRAVIDQRRFEARLDGLASPTACCEAAERLDAS